MYDRSLPYPIKTATPLVHQGPKNLTAHLLCRLVQLCTAHKAVQLIADIQKKQSTGNEQWLQQDLIIIHVSENVYVKVSTKNQRVQNYATL